MGAWEDCVGRECGLEEARYRVGRGRMWENGKEKWVKRVLRFSD